MHQTEFGGRAIPQLPICIKGEGGKEEQGKEGKGGKERGRSPPMPEVRYIDASAVCTDADIIMTLTSSPPL